MKVLVIGASGFLGSKLFKELDKHYDILGTYLTNPNMKVVPKTCRLDLKDKSSVGSILRKWKPEMIVDCSGLTDTDLCEKEKELAYATNVRGVMNLCELASCKIIYFSSDFVFDGEKGLYSETDYPRPINFYGLTKLLAETIVLSKSEENLVIRVSGLFGLSNINNKFVRKLREGRVYGCVDLFSSPTYVDDLCLNFDNLIKHTGLVNFGGPERLSRYEMLKMASAVLGFSCAVIPISAKEMHFIARRPNDTSLVSSVLGFQKTKVKDALTKMREENNERIP